MVLRHLERFSNRFYGFWGLSGKPLEQSEKAEINIMKTFLKRFVPKKIFLAYQHRSWPLTAILYWLHSTQNLLQILARFELSPYYVKPILPLKHLRNDSCLPYFQMFKGESIKNWQFYSNNFRNANATFWVTTRVTTFPSTCCLISVPVSDNFIFDVFQWVQEKLFDFRSLQKKKKDQN